MGRDDGSAEKRPPQAQDAGFWRAAAEALGTMAAFLLLGFGWAALAQARAQATAASDALSYLGPTMPDPAPSDRAARPSTVAPASTEPIAPDGAAPSTPPVEESPPAPRVVFVDGYNTLCAGLLGGYGKGHGHVFNLGHGIHPDVPPEHAAAMVDAVHELSPQYHEGH